MLLANVVSSVVFQTAVQQPGSVRGSTSGTVRGSVSSSSSSMGYAPTTHPPTPPTSMIAGPNAGTLRSGTSPYRTPAPPVNPPSVPANYTASHPLAGAGSMGPVRESGYAPGGVSMQSPPVRMVPPLQQQASGYGSPLPPPMHDISQRPYISGGFGML